MPKVQQKDPQHARGSESSRQSAKPTQKSTSNAEDKPIDGRLKRKKYLYRISTEDKKAPYDHRLIPRPKGIDL